MGSGAMIYIRVSLRLIQAFRKGWIHRHTREHGDSISLLSFFQKKESELKISGLYFIAVKMNCYEIWYYVLLLEVRLQPDNRLPRARNVVERPRVPVVV
jgi:hypothetical protein